MCHARQKIILRARARVISDYRCSDSPRSAPPFSLSATLVRRSADCVYHHGRARARASPRSLSTLPVAALPCPKTSSSSVRENHALAAARSWNAPTKRAFQGTHLWIRAAKMPFMTKPLFFLLCLVATCECRRHGHRVRRWTGTVESQNHGT